MEWSQFAGHLWVHVYLWNVRGLRRWVCGTSTSTSTSHAMLWTEGKHTTYNIKHPCGTRELQMNRLLLHVQLYINTFLPFPPSPFVPFSWFRHSFISLFPKYFKYATLCHPITDKVACTDENEGFGDTCTWTCAEKGECDANKPQFQSFCSTHTTESECASVSQTCTWNDGKQIKTSLRK